MGVANAILIQGESDRLLTQTLDAINMGRKAMYGIVISHRSGESEDRSLPTLRRDECGTNQDGFHVPEPIAWRNTTSCYGSMKNWGLRRVFAGRNP